MNDVMSSFFKSIATLFEKVFEFAIPLPGGLTIHFSSIVIIGIFASIFTMIVFKE